MDTLEPSLVRVLRALGIQELNEVQQLASKAGLYSGSDNIALMSQSRTGKTFAGILFSANEMYKKLCEKQNVKDENDNSLAIIVAPFHASARETAATISQYFGWFLRPLVVFRGVAESDMVQRLTKGTAPNILIATPDALLEFIRYKETRDWLLSHEIVATTLDDVHSILHDPIRGLRIFEVATFFREKITPSPRTLVLSAEFEEPERLESYFGVKLVLDERSYEPPDIKMVRYDSKKEKDAELTDLLQNLADDGVRTLVYMTPIDHMNTFIEDQGSEIGAAISYDIDPLIKERLGRVGSILAKIGYPLSSLLSDGIGVYHGLLSNSERWFIEWAMRRGYLRFIFGSEALAYGITAPVSHVVMESPGMDEVFRQSMMARAIRLRRGRIRPGVCTVFTKTIEDVGELRRVYNSPRMPLRFIDESNLSSILIGLIGNGLMTNENERKEVSEKLSAFFKKGSTTVAIKKMTNDPYPLVKDEGSGNYQLTELGKAAFHSGVTYHFALRIMEGLDLLASSGQEPTEMDLVLIMNHVATLLDRQKKGDAELTEEVQTAYMTDYKSALALSIVDTPLEPAWKRSIEYSLLMMGDENSSPALTTKKTRARLRLTLRMLFPAFTSFLANLSPEWNKKTVDEVLKLATSESTQKLILEGYEYGDEKLRFKDLSFVDFGKIEKTIDQTLVSDLEPLQKARLIELLETVQHTTASFVGLMERSKDDQEAKQTLDIVCGFSEGGLVGRNLVKALEEEGVVERGTIDGLWHKFSTEIDSIQKRTDAPAKAAQVLVSLFTGDIVGLATSSVDALKVAFERTRKVDTSKIS
ncbi:MAG: DEAD/DEAH box helicase [Candidatus Thorarchaeota archaeon]|nr:DEAD/DEAH box helicase [Candidatus Thorarchaeota archaeon]